MQIKNKTRPQAPWHQSDVIRNILVVCAGNICRSPMAEALLRHSYLQLGGDSADRIILRSCGLTAMAGQPADPIAIALLKERGIDISGHRGKQMDAEQAGWADLVLVMESLHKDIIQTQVPGSRGKVFRLGHFSDTDIPDPYRQSTEKFAEVLQVIDENVSRWVQATIQSEAASG